MAEEFSTDRASVVGYREYILRAERNARRARWLVSLSLAVLVATLVSI